MSVSDNEQASESKPDINRKIQIAVVHEERKIRLYVKVFHAMSKIMDAAAKSLNLDPKTLKFTYNGVRLRGHETPEDLEMEDGDCIDAHIEQVGGRRPDSACDEEIICVY